MPQADDRQHAHRTESVATHRSGAGPADRTARRYATCGNVERLGQATTEALRQHPDYQIISSYPGLGDTTAALVRAEIGDDRCRLRAA
jgi:hypothetical protein